jgi:hypothetical protein
VTYPATRTNNLLELYLKVLQTRPYLWAMPARSASPLNLTPDDHNVDAVATVYADPDLFSAISTPLTHQWRIIPVRLYGVLEADQCRTMNGSVF